MTAINGTKALLMTGSGGDYAVIVGQMDLSHTFNGAPIEINTKSNGDWATFINAELSAKGNVVSGDIVFSNDAVFEDLRAKRVAHLITDFKLSFNENSDVDLYFSGVIASMADTLATGAALKTNISINSTGQIYRAQALVTTGLDDFITSDNKTLFARYSA